MRTIGLALCAVIIASIAHAQGSAMEQAVQTGILRDTLRAQQSIANELQAISKTLRRIECLERWRASYMQKCTEGAETQGEWRPQ